MQSADEPAACRSREDPLEIRNLDAGFTDDRCNLLSLDPVRERTRGSPNFFYLGDRGILGSLTSVTRKILASIIEMVPREDERNAQRGIA